MRRTYASGVLLVMVACSPAPGALDAGARPDAAAVDAGHATDAAAAGDASEAGDAGRTADAGTDAPDTSAPRVFAFDLDGDGTSETDLALRDDGGGGVVVLHVERATSSFDVTLPAGSWLPDATGVSLTGRRLRAIGSHVGTPTHEVAVLHQLDRGMHRSAALSIVDVDARAVVASTASPASLAAFESYGLAAFSGALGGTDTRLFPFLAPGYGDGPRASWGYACVYRGPGATGARCGDGFLEIATVPSLAEWFREVGGLVYDADADGTDDLTLVYHQLQRTVSGTTGALLAETIYDVAASDEPGSPPLFHSGRNYGTHAFVEDASGVGRTMIVAGAPVGSFADANCNVSRFVAVLAQPHATPAARTMAWSDYFGFASSIFVHYDPAYAADPSSDLARLGDFEDGCIHRFSDSLATIDGTASVVFDTFVADAPFDTCLDEQYALYLPPAWTPEKSAAWYACFGTNVAQTGTWGMQARRVADGTSVTGSLGTYVWGRTDALLPTHETVYVVESVPMHARFDLADVPPSPMNVWALVGGLWTPRGVLPVAGRPRLVQREAEGDRGVGSFTSLAELDLADTDGDGLAELALESGARFAWSEAAGAFVASP